MFAQKAAPPGIKKIFLAAIALNLFLIIIGGVMAVNSYNRMVVKPGKTFKTVKTDPQANPTPTPDPLGPYSIALLGYGGAGHDGGSLTDTIIVAQIIPRKNSVNLISIPRDLWVNLPIYSGREFPSKVNAAFAIGNDSKQYPEKAYQYTGEAGGGELAKDVITQIVGFKIDHFIALDFQGFIKSIDILGGVDITVPRAFDDYLYPVEGKQNDNCGFTPETLVALEATMSGLKLEQSFTCRFEHLHFDKGINHMSGETALKYVRSRHSATDGGDYNRSLRQRRLITAIKDRIIALNFLPKAIPFMKTLTYNLSTDIDINQLQEYIKKAPEVSGYTINSLALTEDNVLVQGRSPDGQFILMPKEGIGVWNTVHAFIADPTILTPTPSP